MDSCDFCGDSVEHTFSCNYCGQSLCGNHRLPENHECPVQTTSGNLTSFAGEGPQIRDRRGTGRKRRERVQDKETSRMNPPENVTFQNRKNQNKDKSETNVLNCPTCGGSTDRILECEGCGQSICPNCKGVNEHDCSRNDTVDDSRSSDEVSLFNKIYDLFR
ncbi:AN1-type zinc finger domain-containing protein [Halorubrum aquaticum]|uniref:AN1-type zinc finger domain-containing protein n=1 Tax=Halorubrum aquaticum TaxID=387340 RepID=UPI00122CE340|nr:AN1-type zinc finger domain-containing protein [Halorubrum aquaticum]